MQPDELTPLERQLAACRPSAAGLDADAMLFAAGRAAAERRGPRLVWPAVACGFAVLALGLASGWVLERAERVALAGRLRQRVPVAVVASAAAPDLPSELPPDSYLAIRRAIDDGAEPWPPLGNSRPEPTVPPADPPILRAWHGESADLSH